MIHSNNPSLTRYRIYSQRGSASSFAFYLPSFLFSNSRRRPLAPSHPNFPTPARDAIELHLEVAGSLELGSLTALPLAAQGLRLSLFLPPFPCSLTLFLGGDIWASGGTIRRVFAQPFAGYEHPTGMSAPSFPSAVRDGAPQTLTKLFGIRI